MQVGDLVKVNIPVGFKSEMGLIIDDYSSHLGREWVVQPLDAPFPCVFSPCDLEVVNEGR